jgi:predicted nucleic acid-binding protein
MLVVDASVAIRWLFALDLSDRADEVLQSGDHLVAPDLVLAEITNAAWKLAVFGGYARDRVQLAVGAAPKAFEEIVPCSDLKDRALAIALDMRHPVYDCFYLSLADERGCQLVSADNRLIRRCVGTVFERVVRPL